MKNIDHSSEYRRNLPHIQPEGAMFFITFRLHGSIPFEKVAQLREIYNYSKAEGEPNKINVQEDYFLDYDKLLDNSRYGAQYLKQERVAAIVAESIQYRDGKDYKLVCYCIMSNHVHFIIYKIKKPLVQILKELKSYTGKEAMKIIRSMQLVAPATRAINSDSIPFWQAESFDRIIRNRIDMANKINVTLNNPVKAGLVKVWREWSWSYCRPEFIDACM